MQDFDLTQYDYHLPLDRIAMYPAGRRDHSRLMLLDTTREGVTHHRFADLPDLLPPGALLVMNDAKVVPARVFARRASGGRVELFYLHGTAGAEVECLVRASHRPKPGERLTCEKGGRSLTVTRELGQGTFRVLLPLEPGETVFDFLGLAGEIPLPPYIRRAAESLDSERYQTVYAATPGAVAAPTAGLHFTPGLLENLRGRGFLTTTLTLHVGPGTFRPIEVADVRTHRMEGERFDISSETAALVNDARASGRPVVAIGTTTVRALESAVTPDGRLEPGSGEAGIFILPGHCFRLVDHLVTNFHLPGSTLLLLVSALAGRERILDAYKQAVEAGYRFYSYGDAMLIRTGKRHG